MLQQRGHGVRRLLLRHEAGAVLEGHAVELVRSEEHGQDLVLQRHIQDQARRAETAGVVAQLQPAAILRMLGLDVQALEHGADALQRLDPAVPLRRGEGGGDGAEGLRGLLQHLLEGGVESDGPRGRGRIQGRRWRRRTRRVLRRPARLSTLLGVDALGVRPAAGGAAVCRVRPGPAARLRRHRLGGLGEGEVHRPLLGRARRWWEGVVVRVFDRGAIRAQGRGRGRRDLHLLRHVDHRRRVLPAFYGCRDDDAALDARGFRPHRLGSARRP
mmetsp:Transcript_88865/g.248742  ORF Transcript_88865/g.248742 Transcript_88865/m.248742 type:complete len:272 (+) Transcript_88865:960-1775(+)